MIWLTPDSAPKTGTQILGKFVSLPRSAVAVWSGAQEQWCVASPQCEPYEGKWNDYYFENEYLSHSELKAWSEIGD